MNEPVHVSIRDPFSPRACIHPRSVSSPELSTRHSMAWSGCRLSLPSNLKTVNVIFVNCEPRLVTTSSTDSWQIAAAGYLAVSGTGPDYLYFFFSSQVVFNNSTGRTGDTGRDAGRIRGRTDTRTHGRTDTALRPHHGAAARGDERGEATYRDRRNGGK